MWLTILLIVLLVVNVVIGSYLEAKKIRKFWRQRSSQADRRNLLFVSIVFPIGAFCRPWDSLGEHIKTKLKSRYPYLASISKLMISTVLSFTFCMILAKHFFPAWSKSPFSLTTQIIIIGSALSALGTFAILNTQRELREQSFKTKKPG